MTHTYQITGMTCDGCATKVQNLLSKVNGVTDVSIHLDKNNGDITMSRHIPVDELKNALSGTKYKIDEYNSATTTLEAAPTNIFKTYLLVFLIFGYIISVTLIQQFIHPPFNLMQFMQQFMAGFFMVFSFFKLLDIPAFAMSYSSYDIIAKRWVGYGYIYPFIELALGISFLFPALNFWSNIFTLVVMSVSIIGVLQSVFNKKQIQCACLGTVFKLPMSTITIIEDGIMIIMSAASLYLLKT